MSSQADIAIVGGGPCGLVLAGMLEQQGINYIVYERTSKATPPRGGCLDIHKSSGMHAIRAANCLEEFKKYARGGYATIHNIYNAKGECMFAFGEGRESPEIDRTQLRTVLASSVPKEKIRWSTGVEQSYRDESEKVVLKLTDGTTASGFKLVVGADGHHSTIRHLVTPHLPVYSGHIILTLFVRPSNPFHATLEARAGQGPFVYIGRGALLWCQRQGDSHYRIDFGWQGPIDFPGADGPDITNIDAVRKFLLQDEQFGMHDPFVHEIIKVAEGPVHPWPLHHFPAEHLNWSTVSGVTLVGDAAHMTTPYVGDGVNCAMRNALVLAEKIRALGITDEAVSEYEAEMFPYAQDVISRSVESGKLFYEFDAPKGLMENMSGPNPLIRVEADY